MNTHVLLLQLTLFHFYHRSGGDFTRIYKKKKKTFLFDNVICNGMENTLEACQLDVLTNPNCAGPDDFEINVICEKNQNATTPNLGMSINAICL